MTDEIDDLVPSHVRPIFDCLSPAQQDETVRRLKRFDQAWQRYHELLIGQALLGIGYEPEFERDFSGLTPDWYIPTKGDIPAFVVECATRNPSYDTLVVYSIVKGLLDRLGRIAIPSDVAVRIDVENDRVWYPDMQQSRRKNSTPSPQELDRNEQIVGQLKDWIAAGATIGATLEIPYGRAEMIDRIPERDGVRMDWMSASWSARLSKQVIDPDRLQSAWLLDDYSLTFPDRPPEGEPSSLRQNIEDKVEKYAHLNLPLVVAIAADKETLLDFDDVKDVLLGKRLHHAEAIHWTVTVHGMRYGQAAISLPVWPDQEYRSEFGIFHEERSAALSAVIYQEDHDSKRSIVWAMLNPKAANPLPDHAFPRGVPAAPA